MHEPVLVPDFTLLIQMGLFFATYFVLNALVYKPYLALLKARREQTVGLRQKALDDAAQAEKIRAEVEAHSTTQKKQIAAWAEAERKKVHEEERALLQAARNEVTQRNAEQRARLDEQVAKLRTALQGQVPAFSSEIVSKLLGREIQVTSASHPQRAPESVVPT